MPSTNCPVYSQAESIDHFSAIDEIERITENQQHTTLEELMDSVSAETQRHLANCTIPRRLEFDLYRSYPTCFSIAAAYVESCQLQQ